MAHESLAALAHDHPVVRLLDDDPAIGFRVLMPLGAQILDVREGGAADLHRSPRLSRLHRLPRARLNPLEYLCGLLATPGSWLWLHLSGLNALLARLRLHLDGLIAARQHLLSLQRLLAPLLLLRLLLLLLLCGLDTLLVLHRPRGRTRRLGLHRLLKNRLLRVLGPLLGLLVLLRPRLLLKLRLCARRLRLGLLRLRLGLLRLGLLRLRLLADLRLRLLGLRLLWLLLLLLLLRLRLRLCLLVDLGLWLSLGLL